MEAMITQVAGMVTFLEFMDPPQQVQLCLTPQQIRRKNAVLGRKTLSRVSRGHSRGFKVQKWLFVS